MAIKKQIELDNGVAVNYHRIVSINKITNNCNIIEVASYINQSKRTEEIEKLRSNEEMNIFISTQYINSDYDEDSNIENTYKYLKTLEQFKGSEDC